MKKFGTLFIYLAFAVVLVFLITGGGDIFSSEPDKFNLGDFMDLVKQGMVVNGLDEISEGDSGIADAEKSTMEPTAEPDATIAPESVAVPENTSGENRGVSIGRNTVIGAVQITEETLYGIYTFDYSNNVKKADMSEADYLKLVQQFEKGKAYQFSVTVSSSEIFSSEMARLISSVTGMDPERVTISDYGFGYTLNPTPTTSWFVLLLPYLLIFGGLIAVFFMMRSQSGNRQAANFAKSNARIIIDPKNKKTFNDVQGAEEEKQELQEVVDFLRSPQAFTEMGARIPKGVLLVGPPGTGKTLLAKAAAGEANVPFFSISGSDFVEMFVGVGASRVRDLFQNAKRSAPAIVFIDEIDAVGRQRGAGLGGGHDEREQTLNQLLVEMDGFTENSGIIVIAATNRPDVLDPALLRPGRFDRQITVNYPDVKGREAILRLHAKNKPLGSDVNLETLAKLTTGFTGADLENVLNEAAILAARSKLKKIGMAQIDEAVMRVIAGPEKKSRMVSAEDKFITANHEVGHAIVARALDKCDNVHELSIIQRGRAAGYTITRSDDDNSHMTKGKILDSIAMLLGGRVAETERLEDISTGAENDLKRASKLARRMVTEFGMSDAIGPVYLAGETEVFIGRELGHQRNYSEAVSASIDAEVRRILEEQFERAKRTIAKRKVEFDRVVTALLEHEHITGTEFEKLYMGVEDWQDKPAELPNADDVERIESPENNAE